MGGYNITCVCGKSSVRTEQHEVFECEKCGRKSVIDFTMGYSERELLDMLNDLDVKRDHVAKVIEMRRQQLRKAS